MKLEPAQAWPELSLVADAMRRLVDDGQFAGVATEVWRDGTLMHRAAAGYGDVARGAPMRPDSIARIYSMTKPVTAVAMMILRDQGIWKPEDPIARDRELTHHFVTAIDLRNSTCRRRTRARPLSPSRTAATRRSARPRGRSCRPATPPRARYAC